jgi:hypothetical protein
MAKAAVNECNKAMRGIKRTASRASMGILDRVYDGMKVQAALVCIITNDVNTAVWFLRWYSRRGYFDQGFDWADDQEDLKQQIRAISEDVTIRGMACNGDNSEVCKARRWIAEWQLLIWLVHLNVKGIAPSSKEMLEEYRLNILSLNGDGAHDHLDSVEKNATSRANWCRTFRQRWGLAYKTMMPGHEFNDIEITRRVPSRTQFCVAKNNSMRHG